MASISSTFPTMPWRDLQFDAYVSSANSKVEKVQPIDNTMDTVTHDATTSTYTQYMPKETMVEKSNQKNKISEKSDIKDINNTDKIEDNFEVDLPSTSFGFNEDSKDFFIKVQRGDFTSQYPTEEMMKLKIYHQNLLNKLV